MPLAAVGHESVDDGLRIVGLQQRCTFEALDLHGFLPLMRRAISREHADCTAMALIEKLQEIKSLAPTNLAQDYPVWPLPKRGLQKS
jgi:hypothetical protein